MHFNYLKLNLSNKSISENKFRHYSLICYLFHEHEAFAKEGMPQLNPEFWLSQIVWLTIVFALLYFLIQKFFSPKLFALIDTRTNFIKSLLEEAEVCKNQIQKLDR